MTETKDYAAAAEWAEGNDVPQTDRAMRGDAAAAYAREQLERAGVSVPVGRPKLDPNEKKAGRSPRRQVRLPQTLSDDLDQLATEQGREVSVIMREAIAEYLHAHKVS